MRPSSASGAASGSGTADSVSSASLVPEPATLSILVLAAFCFAAVPLPIARIAETRHRYYPVCRGHIDDIVGVLALTRLLGPIGTIDSA